jgi:hypothetical protein
MVTLPLLVTVAAGLYAPGHLGELTRYLPFELVDDVLGITGTAQKRLRALPSRVGMYFVLALALFPGIGCLRVWDKMTAALEDLGPARPSEKGLRDLRRRLGPAPVRLLFETIAGPLAPPRVPGVSYRGLRTVAFDGLNSVKVPDSDRNRSWLGKTMTRLGLAGYPAMRIVALAETGTRGLLGAVIGGRGQRSEVPLARKLVPLLRKGMLLLADRAYDAADLLKEAAATGAHVLVRGSASRKPAVEQTLPDGSYLSDVDGLAVRIIEADLDVHGADGTRLGDSCRLITTLLDWRRYPAGELVRLYHERWEIEVAYLALRHTLLGGYVLRSRDRAGAEQELWALLAVYQALRMAMTAAAEAAGTDPDRASFTAALESAREQVITARGIEDSGDPDDTGRIGRAVLAGLLPARRARCSARKVKCSTSRYHVRDQDRPELPTRITRVQITIIAPPPDRPAARPRSRKNQPAGPRQPRPDTRRDRSPAPWPAGPDATGPGATSRPCSASSPATCSPSSPNGPASASSPRPAPAGTRSPAHPQLQPPLPPDSKTPRRPASSPRPPKRGKRQPPALPRYPRRHRFPPLPAPRVTGGKPARRAGPLTAGAPETAQQQAVPRPPKRLRRARNCVQPRIVTVRQR